MKKILALVLAVVMVLALAACGGNGNTTGPNKPGPQTPSTTAKPEGPQEITLTVWGPSEDQVDENSWLNVMLKKFEEAYKDEYKINWVTGVCAEGDAFTKVSADVEAAADVYFYANDQLGSLVNAQALAKLGGSYEEQVKKDNSQTFVDTVTYTDGGVYGFPTTANTWFMYYDTRVLSADDVKSLDTMLEKTTVAFPITNPWYIWSFYAAAGGTLFGDKGIDAAAGIQLGAKATDVTKYLVNLANNPNFINDADGVGISGLRDGSVGAIFSGTWDAKSVQEALTDSEGVCHMGVTQLPTFNLNGEALTMKSFAGSKAIGVNRQSKNMGAALKLAAFLSTEEAQLLHYQLREIPPAVSALTSNEEIAKNLVVVGQALTMSNSSVGQPTIPEMNNYWGPAGNLGTAIYNKEVTLDNAAEQTELFQDALNGTGL